MNLNRTKIISNSLTTDTHSLVTVIIPTFNRAKTLERAIVSVLEQDYLHKELIVVDDGSTDETSELLKRYLGKIKIFSTQNQGVSAARNLGIQQAQGKRIAFLDSDDYWNKGKLSKQVEVLQKNKDYKLVYTNEIWIRNGKRVNQCKIHKKYGGDIYKHCLPLCIISPSSVLIEMSVFKDVGLFDESLPACEDYDMWLRVSSKYKVYFLDEFLITKTGGHEDQLSRKYWGMDRFRLKALLRAFNSNLNSENKKATKKMIEEKVKVLMLGFQKRNKRQELECMKKILRDINS